MPLANSGVSMDIGPIAQYQHFLIALKSVKHACYTVDFIIFEIPINNSVGHGKH